MRNVLTRHNLRLELRWSAIVMCAGLALSMTQVVGAEKSASRLITADMRDNAVKNIERYEWADPPTLGSTLQHYKSLSDAQLWLFLPSQAIPRTRVLPLGADRRDIGCPQCYLDNDGKSVGPPQWHMEWHDRPWEVKCEHCNTWFPKNDFAAYYQSAIDENGMFKPGAGNPQHLQPRDGVEGEARQWIEDGMGVSYEGHTWYFAGAHARHRWRRLMPLAARGFATHFTLTNDSAYARLAAIILDRVAHVYPTLDERVHEQRGADAMGYVYGYGPLHWAFARAYDYIYDGIHEDQELARRLSRIRGHFDGTSRHTFDQINEHLRQNMLLEFAASIKAEGGHRRGHSQRAMAAVAAALDDPKHSPELFDWIFRAGGGEAQYTLVEWMNRDGLGVNPGMGYSIFPPRTFFGVADVLYHYSDSPHDLYRDYPNFMNAPTLGRRTRILDHGHLNIGDTGQPMQINEIRLPLEQVLAGYRALGGQQEAMELFHRAEGDFDRIRRELIYEADPDDFIDQLRQDLPDDPLTQPFRSFNSGGHGLAVLQAPDREHPRATAINYDVTMSPSHAHADRLALHVRAFGEDLMPDLGRAQFLGDDPKRHGWKRHVVSHNTVMVDDVNQGVSYAGKTQLFADAGSVRVADIDGLGGAVSPTRERTDGLYPQLDTYRRNVVMIDVDDTNSYLLDLFWVRGGKTHRLIQNGGASEVSHDALSLERQPTGTLAGEDVAFGEAFDGELTWRYQGSGLSFLKNVSRDHDPPRSFWTDWRIEPRHDHGDAWQGHLRVHNLGALDEVALADGTSQPGHLDEFRYLVRSRFGETLQSQFITVIEPYMQDPFIDSVKVLDQSERTDSFAAAVRVDLMDGRHDIVLVREADGELLLNNHRVSLRGRIGHVRFGPDGEVESLSAIAAERLRAGDREITLRPGALRGKLVGVDDSDPQDVQLRLDKSVDGHDIVGQYIVFDNQGRSDGSYLIEEVVDSHTISIGQMPLYEKLRDVDDYEKGVVYNVKQGDHFIIPNVTSKQFNGNGSSLTNP